MSMRLSLARTLVIARTTAAIGIVALLGSAVIAAQNAPVRAGTPGVSHPGIVEAGPPVYPPIAQSARVQGAIIHFIYLLFFYYSFHHYFHSTTLLYYYLYFP